MKNLHNGTSPLQKKEGYFSTKFFLVQIQKKIILRNVHWKVLGGTKQIFIHCITAKTSFWNLFEKKENFQKWRVLNADFDACFCS